jgi:small subunit ribosomal protein S2
LFIVDINKEHIAVAEARRLNIPTFAIVDTNCNPDLVDFPIPANDDASKSISVILKSMVDAIQEGINERKLDKEVQDDERDADDDVLVNDDENLDNADAPKARRPRKMSEEGDDKPRRPRKSAVKKN